MAVKTDVDGFPPVANSTVAEEEEEKVVSFTSTQDDSPDDDSVTTSREEVVNVPVGTVLSAVEMMLEVSSAVLNPPEESSKVEDKVVVSVLSAKNSPDDDSAASKTGMVVTVCFSLADMNLVSVVVVLKTVVSVSVSASMMTASSAGKSVSPYATVALSGGPTTLPEEILEDDARSTSFFGRGEEDEDDNVAVFRPKGMAAAAAVGE